MGSKVIPFITRMIYMDSTETSGINYQHAIFYKNKIDPKSLPQPACILFCWPVWSYATGDARDIQYVSPYMNNSSQGTTIA